MQLVRLEVTNWRGVASKVIEFDEKITVVGGENESGKSSLRAALRAALLMPSGKVGEKKKLERERPWETSLYPTVELEFIANGVTCTVKKEFLRKKEWAQLRRDGRLVAQDDQVQPELMKLLGDSAEWIDVLWGEQGRLTYETAPESIKGKLASAAQATVLPQVAELEDLINKEYLQYWTPSTAKPNKKLTAVRDEAIGAEERLEEAEARLKAANDTSEHIGQATIQLEALKSESEKLEAEWKKGQESLGAWESYNAALAKSQQARAAFTTAEQWLANWRERTTKLRELIPQAEVWKARAEQLEEQTAKKPDRKVVEELTRKLKYLDLSIASEKYLAAQSIAVPTAPELARAGEIEADLREIEISLKLGVMKAKLTAESNLSAVSLVSDSPESASAARSPGSAGILPAPDALTSGQSKEWESIQSFNLHIPGVARLEVSSGNPNVESSVQRRDILKLELTDFLKKWQAPDLDTLTQKSQEKAAQLKQLRPVDAAILRSAREGVPDAAEIDAASLEQREATLEALPSTIALEEELWRQSHAAHTTQMSEYQDLMKQNPVIECKTLWQGLISHAAAMPPIADLAPPVVDEIATVQFLNSIATDETMWREKMETLRLEADRLEKEAVRPVGEELSKKILDNLRTLADEKKTSINDLSAMLNQAIGEVKGQGNLFEFLVRAKEELAKSEAEQTRVDMQAYAIRELHATFNAARQRLQKDVVAPLQLLVGKRFGTITSGFYNAVAFDSTLKANGVAATSVGTTVPLDDISFGTREQLALLTRLCLAELLSEAGERQTVILDDNLVHTDTARMALACRLMEDSAHSVQIVVFTCHPERYSEFSAKQVFMRRG
ncbi:MAG: AAA family ATPase [Candidatus Obscuribacterales bacterium]|nr:AAA family ATPase [Candidatus Obscuribacterales bacterium]